MADFDDEKLLAYLEENQISYKYDDNGLIELLPNHDGKMPAINVPSSTHQVILNQLKSCGNIFTKKAALFSANALETVHGDIDAPFAEELYLNSLFFVKRYTDACSTSVFEAGSLRKTGPIFLSPAMAKQENDGLLFSGHMGSRHKISLFNKNTGMVKIDYYPWLPLDTMEEIIDSIYETGRNRNQYMRFISLCKTKHQSNKHI